MRHLCRGLIVTLFVAIVAVVGADVWTSLGTTDSEAGTQTVQTALTGRAPWLGIEVFKKAPAAARAAFAQQALGWVKVYTQSPAFKTAYETARSNLKPTQPEIAPPWAEQLKKQEADIEANAAQMRKDMASQPKEVRDQVEASIAAMREQMKKMRDPSQMKTMEDVVAQQNVANQAAYKEQLAEFEKKYPADPKALVATRLRNFLDVCGTVDFNAALVKGADGKMKFTNAQYEQKPSEWKMCFRAGKEPVEAAKTVVTAWLKEIGG